ncbi:MAG: secretin N-terminal domain-containing protein [Gallionella sp.]|nr:secretin N-terminal domain-containing protein [Gallionella sp.]
MRNLLWLGVVLLMAGCATQGGKNTASDAIQREMNQAAQGGTASAGAVGEALLPPLAVEMPKVDNKPLEVRFDLSVNNTPVSQIFMAIVSGTRYSMLLHPEVSGNISLNLKDVTVFEALEAIHEMYGYDYKVDGTRIYIQPLTLQTRIFQVNYLTGNRAGTSSVRVTSSALSDTATGSSTAGGVPAKEGTTIVGGGDDKGLKFLPGNDNSSKVTTTTSSNFWDELSQALHTIVGKEAGRNVVISPMSGVIVIRAMPDELKNVAAYLKASQISIERQVILEAKIVEVQLSDGFQSGVNWAAFRQGRAIAGQTSTVGGSNTLIANGLANASQMQGTIPGTLLGEKVAAMSGGMFGMVFSIGNFGAMLDFLETQGNVHVLSSPRIATLNNQKAVLKVGTDEFFVTEISGGTQATTTVAGTPPTVKVQPFFSGIALDVTPRIDANNEIILHVHPSVSSVSTVTKTLNLGTGVGTYNLPLASSSVSETDSIVRAKDGQIVAIGGLMRQATFDDQSGLPGLPKSVFGQTSKRNEKRELIILLKPTVVDNDKDWAQDITQSRDRFNGMAGSAAKP